MTSTEDVLNEIEENSLQIISVAQKVAKILSFLPLWLSPPYDNVIRLEYFSEEIYI